MEVEQNEPKKQRRRMVLLGAGASMPHVPSAYEMTKRMLDAVEGDNVPKRIRRAVRMAVASLQFGVGLRDERPTGDVNIEEVVNVLTTLEQRHTLEAASLIGAWHPIVEDLDRITVQPNPPLVRGVAARGGAPHATTFAFPSREVPAFGKVFTNTKRFLVEQLKSLVWLNETTDLHHLEPLVKRAAHEQIPLATLNYDNTIELVARKLQLRFDTGIEHWRKHGSFNHGDSEGIPFRKLHGSLNWVLRTESAVAEASLSREVIAEVDEREMQDAEYEPALIFGGRNKLTVRGPFLDLLLDFRERLRASEDLIVIGYSFGDDHINEYIAQWLNTSSEGRVIIVNGTNFQLKARGFARALIDLGSPRVLNTMKYASDGIEQLFN
ncbi:hypothetical protein CfE428DRAFT_0063 [Chthoniobacter flavus Ellin428]|uniref:Uncharacterized protein n=1 Tax=Chthoniobacter flavus Ellin428 TaxID=497964 RepID=B4CTP2_9BACT|nr:SIR2 family protein [Chthoniobacter flavus]EDY21938.1 hypothetical protein CfE428DRAFT_0063 [Chthoniobacter flavus Ellin428]TCO89328.1 SIR2-like protein [Chthoniobacter flavus]